MPLDADSVVQEALGTSTASNATMTVFLPAGTAAGSSVVVVIYSLYTPGTPTGWVADVTTGAFGGFQVYHRSNVDAGESSWGFTFNSVNTPNIGTCWYVAEVTGLDPDVPFDVSSRPAGSTATPPGSWTVSTGTAPISAASDLLIVEVWGVSRDSGTPTPAGTFGGYAQDVTVVGQVLSPDAAQTRSLTATRRLSGGANPGPFADTATYTDSTAGTGIVILPALLTFRASDSPIGFPVKWMAGFEHGSHFGLGSATTIGFPLFNTVTGTVGTDIQVGTSFARAPSVYGCRITQAAAAKSLFASGNSTQGQLGGPLTAVLGFNVRVASSTGLVVLAALESTSTGVYASAQMVYDTATSRLGMRLGTTNTPGAPVYQSGTTAAGAWVWVEMRARLITVGANVTASVDWAVGGVVQPKPADAASGTTNNWWSLRWGTTTTQTVTFDIDDLCFANQSPAFPLGQHTIRALTVDPAGTSTVNGTVGNFALVTANATGATLTAGTLASARNAIDELPPTISAASDGVVQINVAAADYLQFPMAVPSLAVTDVPAAVKVIAALISTAGAGAGTLSIKGWDGAAEAGVIATTTAMTPGSSTTPSGTVPPYGTGMWPNTWTPARLAAAALRIGYSTDATPDMGVHAAYLEYATRQAVTARQVSVEGGAFTVDLVLSPYSSASIAYVVASNDPARGATLAYTVTGAAQAPVYVPPGTSTTVTVQVDAFGDVGDLSLTPDPAV